MTQFVLSTVLSDYCSRVTPTHNDNRSIFRGFNVGIEQSRRSFCERREFKDTGWSSRENVIVSSY
jgi:hypothetical protein